ncbi:MAG: hypothetical protein IKL26_01600 [Bacteroidales bacterium]|nr:hypothetical protein [Bacteroidales bacterium]
MNKKLFLGMFAAAGMLLATSCMNDELDVVQSGNEAQVTFSLGLEGDMATRAISDGTKADKLVYAVYKLNANGEPELQNVVGSNNNGQFVKTDFKSGDNVSITLAKGQTYQVAFWAQDEDCKAYDTDDLTAVEVKYKNEDGTNAVNNDELRDAFFKMVQFEVAGDKSIDVVMKRPFAQINVGVDAEDWDAAVASGIEIKSSNVVIKNAATSINLLTGAVSGNETVVTYISDTIPDETLYVETDATKQGKEAYKWLSMSYILVNDTHDVDEDKDGTIGDYRTNLESLEYTFTPESGNAIEFAEGLNNVPVQRNWRTNILGKILTGDIQFNITIDPVYDGDINVEDNWSDGYTYEETTGTYHVYTAEGMIAVAALVGADTLGFEGKTILLENDIDLKGVKTMGSSFAPIGSTGERDGSNKLICDPFKGTFDGQDHAIKNLYQSGWDMGYEWGQYGSLGLFAELEGATVKNLVIEGVEAQVEGGDISFVAGSATGDCVFENITIKDSKIGTYNNGCGGIIGWSGAGTYTFKNITLESDVVLGGLWGSFDSSIGGIVGQAEPGATYNFENVEINCRIDAYNDCTASYDYYNYRMCGMIIGRCEETTTINGINYPDLSKYYLSFNNVVVNYGEWMYYHYCEPTPGHNGGRGMRIEPGYAYGGLPADFDHTQCVDNHYNCIPFDQLIGGDQLGVKGLREVNGVTVNYPETRNVYTAKELAEAVAAGYSNIRLEDGEYDVYGCGGKNLTISGSKKAIIKLYNEGEDGCDYAFGGNGTGVGTYVFNGVTIDTQSNTGNYRGFAYMGATFNDCAFVGPYSLNNANDFVFNRCTFDFKNGYFWTWGANSVKFDGCTFNGNSKAILAHGFSSTAITIKDCTFAATEKGYTGSGDNTATVEIDPAGTNTYTITFTGNNTKTDSYNGWTRIKDGSTGHNITEPN